jgi:hypothetical protein
LASVLVLVSVLASQLALVSVKVMASQLALV